LIRDVVSRSRIPVVRHEQGVCHTYIDRSADLVMAAEIAFNAKCQRPGTCNAMETLLVHQDVSADLLPELCRRYAAAGVELRGDPAARRFARMKRATEADWGTEYLDRILSIRVVGSLDEALAHIARHGSAHTDAIVTTDQSAAERFLREVDSACVLVNASTRLHDGHEFGMGAEIGISTGKLHARGPMGLRELVTYKWQVLGTGQLRK
jgi:glutamate-5-semialdehyde dehydrogenase